MPSLPVGFLFWSWTKRIDGREAASHIASASIKSFLLLSTNGRTELRRDKFYVMTDVADTRAIKCAPAQASITTTEDGHVTRNCISFVRVNFLRKAHCQIYPDNEYEKNVYRDRYQ